MISQRHIRIPRKSDTKIDFNTFKNIAEQSRSNINFDPTVFNVSEDSYGMFISMNPQSVTTTSNASGYHLSGEVTQSNCAGAGGTLIVHGGVACRKTNSNVYAIALTCDVGPSEFYEDYKTLTAITTSKYVYAEFDDPLIPTTLTINSNATYPVDDANKYTKFVLGYANVASDVLTWEPYREMDLTPDSPVIPDSNMNPVVNRSVAFKNPGGCLELYGLSNAAGKMLVGVEPTGSGVDVVYRDTNVASIAIGAGANAAGSLDSIARSDHYHHVSNADYATASNNASHATWSDFANSSSNITHALLADIAAGTNATDDHFGGANFVLLAKTGDNTRNKVDNGFSSSDGTWSVKTGDRTLYNASGAITVTWGAEELQHAAHTRVNWSNAKCYADWATGDKLTINFDAGYLVDGTDSQDNIVMRWKTRKLSYSDWEVTATTDITNETYASGVFRVAGGLSVAKSVQADKYQLLDDADNYWSANALSVVTTDNIILNSPAILYGNTASTGVTINNWSKIGGLVGAGIAPITIYANTGSTVVQMEVLARI